MCEILYAAAFIAGEYLEYCKDHAVRVLCALLVPKQVLALPEHIQVVYMQTVFKVVAFLLIHSGEVCLFFRMHVRFVCVFFWRT